MKTTLVILSLGVAFPAWAGDADSKQFDACVRKLCTSVSQSNCWIKAGAALCDKSQIDCKPLPDHAPAKVIRKVGHRWQVETIYGKGWVSDRMTQVDSGAC